MKYQLLNRQASLLQDLEGVMDEADPDDLAAIRAAIALASGPHVLEVHALRSRHQGPTHHVDFHLRVPGHLTVAEASAAAARLRRAVEEALPGARVLCHLDPVDVDPDPARR